MELIIGQIYCELRSLFFFFVVLNLSEASGKAPPGDSESPAGDGWMDQRSESLFLEMGLA